MLGDARLSLEREPPQDFDVLAVDAFSSDAIPVHLITREALGLYLRHMKPGWHRRLPRLQPLPRAGAGGGAPGGGEPGARGGGVRGTGGEDTRTQSDWVLVSRDARALQAKEIEEAGAEAGRGPRGPAHLDRRLLQPRPDPEVALANGSDPNFACESKSGSDP